MSSRFSEFCVFQLKAHYHSSNFSENSSSGVIISGVGKFNLVFITRMCLRFVARVRWNGLLGLDF